MLIGFKQETDFLFEKQSNSIEITRKFGIYRMGEEISHEL
jgi:hypothetical protein